ncbi:MAG: hypothetical protein IKY16_00065 [Bacteroidales bacterium]|nr:hypothetical protein [Bacteroidales bacterium]
MKRTCKKALYGLAAISAMALYSCTELAIEENVIPEEPVVEETAQAVRITVGLHGADPDTRLSYHEATVDGKKVMKTLWSEGDALTANATPGNETNAYTFNLIEGEGTSIGVFECDTSPNGYSPTHFSSNAWTIYFPGTIQGEQDYFDFTYLGQVQNGNGNMDHLKNFHSLRLSCTDIDTQVFFDNSFIDLSGEELEESSCMKFNLSGLPSGVVPDEIKLSYLNGSGAPVSIFHTHNTLSRWWTGASPVGVQTSSMSLDLEGFSETASITAYMMLSNASLGVKAGHRFRVTVTAEDGKRYYCDKTIGSDLTIKGGTLNSITCTSWTEITAIDNIDGLENPEEGVVILQEASIGSGTDIVIMGDGFSASTIHFGESGDYEDIMIQAYEDLFSVEPFKTLKPYFNVYYINAVSEDEHDAQPYTDAYGNQNGAIQGTAVTKFNTQFTPGATTITGDNATAISYAAQAIMAKGGIGGTECNESTAITRANKALIMVMVNVPCHAGTCTLAWDNNPSYDYGNAYSVAYTALGNNDHGRKWTTIHEAGGHGFGKLADEYEGRTITSFSTTEWIKLQDWHNCGVYRNIDQYWGPEEIGWSTPLSDTNTDKINVYWSNLFSTGCTYETTEGLGVYRGGFTYTNLYCRPSENSTMRNQFAENGQYFNAISRWAIWYRVMKLTGCTSASQFKDSFAQFIEFDKTLTITKNGVQTKGHEVSESTFVPTAPPVLVQGHWENGRFITE